MKKYRILLQLLTLAVGTLFSWAALLSASASAQTATTISPALSTLCRSLGQNLTVGSRGSAVLDLQQYLVERGYSQSVTGYFGPLTRSNVVRLQQTLGVTPAFGYFGSVTRAALTAFCAQPSPSETVTITGPSMLAVGQSGTWTVTTGSGAGNAAFYILWGDTRYDANTSVQQSLAFSHSYTATGAYAIKIFVVTSSGAVRYATASVVVSATSTIGGVTVTSPVQGQTVARGAVLPISWNYPVTPGNAHMIVDLYSVTGGKVGTIAISNDTIGSFNWSVPVPNTVCTLQYPNGLCGQNLSGQYYIRVSAVTGTGFEPNPNIIASGNSGIFTIIITP